MKVRYQVNNALVFEVEAETTKELFRSLADIQEAFEADKSCGLCNGPIQFRVRTINKNEFFELVCRNCQGTLPLGQTKDGERVYPKHKPGAKNRGWEEPYSGQREPEYEGAAARR